MAPQVTYEQLKRRIMYLEGEIHKMEGQLEASDLHNRMLWTDVENFYKGMRKDSEEFQRKIDQRKVRFRNGLRKIQDQERITREHEERSEGEKVRVAETSRKEARTARETYYGWCKYGEKTEEKPRKDMLGFLVKELNSLNAVIGTLKDEIMARRMRVWREE
ncbi:hypothetical protein ACHAPF_011074 [Botrytis cinerea]